MQLLLVQILTDIKTVTYTRYQRTLSSTASLVSAKLSRLESRYTCLRSLVLRRYCNSLKGKDTRGSKHCTSYHQIYLERIAGISANIQNDWYLQLVCTAHVSVYCHKLCLCVYMNRKGLRQLQSYIDWGGLFRFHCDCYVIGTWQGNSTH